MHCPQATGASASACYKCGLEVTFPRGQSRFVMSHGQVQSCVNDSSFLISEIGPSSAQLRCLLSMQTAWPFGHELLKLRLKNQSAYITCCFFCGVLQYLCECECVSILNSAHMCVNCCRECCWLDGVAVQLKSVCLWVPKHRFLCIMIIIID